MDALARTEYERHNAPGRRLGLACILAAMLFCLASALPAREAQAADLGQIEVSVPTQVPCAVMADGTVVGPSNWEIKNTGDAIARLSGVSASYETDGGTKLAVSAKAKGSDVPFFGLSDDGTTFLPIDLAGGSTTSVEWGFEGKLDPEKDASLISKSLSGAAPFANVSLSFKCIQNQPVAFAVYSDDDKSLDFYKRTEVPAAGEQFDGKTATAVYTGIEEGKYNSSTRPWKDRSSTAVRVETVDDGIKPTSLESWFSGFSSMAYCELSKFDMSECESLKFAFYCDTELTDFGAFDWDLEKCDTLYYAFYNCSKVENLHCVSTWRVGNVENFASAFSNCGKLRLIDLSNWDMHSATTLNSMFLADYQLPSIGAVSDWYTYNVTDMSQVFTACMALTDADVRNWSLQSCTTISGMFNSCGSLSSLDLSGWMDTGNVRNMEALFNGCYNLKSISVANWDTSSLENMNRLFFGCSALTSLDLSGWDDSKVTTAKDCFAGLASLERITVGNTWKWAQGGLLTAPPTSSSTGADGKWYAESTMVGYEPSGIPQQTAETYWAHPPIPLAVYSQDDGSLDFYRRFQIPEVGSSFEGKAATAVYSMVGATKYPWAPWSTYAASVSTSKVVDEGIAPKYIDHWFDGMSSLASCDVSNLDMSQCLSAIRAFSGATSLKSLDTSNWDLGNLTDASYMFYGCQALSGLNTSKWSLTHCVDMRYMFYDCASLTTLNALNWDTSANRYFNYTFAGCLNLNSNFTMFLNAASATTTAGMLQNCEALTSAIMMECQTPNLKDISHMFEGCKSVSVITMRRWDTSKVETMEFTFANCPKLSAAVAEDFDTSSCLNFRSAFMNDANLSHAGAQNWNVSAGVDFEKMFYGCSSIQEIAAGLPWDVSNAEALEDIFNGCSNVPVLDLSSWDVSKAEANLATDRMFAGCSSLSEVSLSDKFTFPTDGSYLPTPEGGLWYNQDTGERYAPEDIPRSTAATYRTSAAVIEGTVMVTGDFVVGGKLTATAEGMQGYVVPAYQWTRDGASISGATSATYVPTPDDYNHSVACVVSDASGKTLRDIKSAAATIGKGTLPKLNTSITGQRVYGQTLAAGVSGLPAGVSVSGYQWKAADSATGSWADISGATSDTLALNKDVIGKYVKCTVSLASDCYVVAPVDTQAAGPIGKASASAPSVAISGDAKWGSTLTASVSGLPGEGNNQVSYQWQVSADGVNWRDSLNEGYDTPSLVVNGSGSIGQYYRCVVGVSNPYYSVPSAPSAASAKVTKGAASAVSVSVSGEKKIEKKLAANVSGAPAAGETTYSYQWQYSEDGKSWSDSKQPDAYDSALTPDYTWVGFYARVVVTPSNPYYDIPAASSNTFGPLAKGDASAPTVGVSGSAVIGGTLTASVSGLPAHGTNDISYQWQVSADGEGWVDSTTNTGMQTASLKLSDPSSLNLYYRCVVTVSNSCYEVPQGQSGAVGPIGKGSASIAGALSAAAPAVNSPITATVTSHAPQAASASKFTYKWEVADSASAAAWTAVKTTSSTSATSDSYTPTPATLGKYLRCTISGDNTYFTLQAWSRVSASSVAQGELATASAKVALSGTATYGQTLTATVSGLPSGASAKYQWYRGTAAISGATSSKYTLTKEDVGKQLKCVVTDSSGAYKGSVSTAASAAVAKAKAAATATVSGSAVVGGKLTCSVSGLPSVGTNNVSYQWQYSTDGGSSWHNSTISPSNASSLALPTGALNSAYRCVVTVSGNECYDVACTPSSSTAKVGKGTAAMPTVSVTGAKGVGSTLTATVSGQPAVTTATAYQWQRADSASGSYSNISGATGKTYVLTTADLNKYLKCSVTTTSIYYNVPAAASAAYGAIGKGSASEPTVSISGTATYGQTLTANVSGLPSAGTNSNIYQWQRADSASGTYSNISGATSKTYQLGAADVGKCLKVTVGTTNTYYTVPSKQSGATSAVAKAKATATATISGDAVTGGTITCNVGGLPSAGTNNVSYKWQWSKDGSTGWTDSAYSDKNSKSMKLQAADVNCYYRCIVTVSGNACYDVSGATSAATAKVGKGTAATPTVTVSGTKQINRKLTAAVSGQPSGVTSTTYQWQYSSDGKSWTDSAQSDAKSSSFTPNYTWAGLYARCVVTTSSSQWNVPVAYSTAYGPIAKGAAQASVAISGAKSNTSKLTANVSGLPANGTNAVSYKWQWSKDGSTGWTDSTYTDKNSQTIQMKVADVGYYYRCIVTVSGNAYYDVAGATSAAYGPMAKTSAQATASLSGSAVVGGTLKCTVGGLPSSGTNNVSYQWQYSDDGSTWHNSTSNAGVQTSSMTLSDPTSINRYYRCAVSVSGNAYYDVKGANTSASAKVGKGSAGTPTVSISGDKKVGGKLTASVSGLPSAGTNAHAYQWQRADSASGTYTNISGATSKDYTLTTSDLNKYLKCSVSTTNTYYNVPSKASDAYGAIGKGSASAPTVTVSGTATYGQTLTAAVSEQPTGTTATAYQWQRCDTASGTYTAISGATSSKYTLGTADVGKYVRCSVATTNTYYTVTTGYSAAKGAVAKATASTPTVSISGTKGVGSKLTASVSGLPSAGSNTVSYQWQYSSDGGSTWTNSKTTGCTTANLTTDTTWLNLYARCVVTVSNPNYTVGTAYSSSYGPIGKGTASAPAVTISGATTYGQTLTANVSGQPAGTTATSYQWQRCDTATGTFSNISGATGKTYAIGTADVGKYLKVTVGTTSTYYTVASQPSAATSQIAKATVTATATVSGSAVTGGTITCNVGNLPSTGTNNVSYQWQYSSTGTSDWTNSAYSDKNSKSMKLQGADVNYYYRCVVSVSGNAYYNVNGATSAATAKVTKGTAATPTVTVTGTKGVGSTLTATVSGQPTGVTSTTYQWQRADTSGGTYSNISGATGKTYVLTTADLNKFLKCVVATSSSHFNVPSATSAAYGAIGKGSASTPTASVSGTKTVGSTLTANISGMPSAGTNTNTYQWQRADSASGTYSNISGATARTYKLTTSDLNKYLRCVIGTTNTYYTVPSATSAAYGAIGKGSASAPTVTVSGTATYGQVLTAAVSGQPTGTTATTYQWQRCDTASGTYTAISGATSSKYTLGAADVGKYVRCSVATTNTYYAVTTGYSAAKGAVAKATASAPTVAISGTKGVGATLAASVSGQPSGTNTTTYQWQRADSASGTYSNISGATSKTYSLTTADFGKYLKCVVATANANYTVPSATSNAYGSIGKGTTPTPTLRESGNLAQTSYTFIISGLPSEGTNTTTYQWQRADSASGTYSNISGATSKTYYKTDADTGKYLRCIISTTNTYFNVPTVTSDVIPVLTSYAVYSADDGSLNFYRRVAVPNAGDKLEGKTVTAVYPGINTKAYTAANAVPWFGYRASIKSITAVDSGIAPMSLAYWFYGITSSCTVDLSKFEMSQTKSLEQTFSGSKGITSINTTGWRISSATTMYGTFAGCQSLTSITGIESWMPASLQSMERAFYSCIKLKSLDLKNWNVSKVKTFNSAFSQCRALTTISGGTTTKNLWDTSSATNMDSMFYYCSALSLDASAWNVYKVTSHKSFDTSAAGVTEPSWNASDEEIDDTSILTASNDSAESTVMTEQAPIDSEIYEAGNNGIDFINNVVGARLEASGVDWGGAGSGVDATPTLVTLSGENGTACAVLDKEGATITLPAGSYTCSVVSPVRSDGVLYEDVDPFAVVVSDGMEPVIISFKEKAGVVASDISPRVAEIEEWLANCGDAVGDSQRSEILEAAKAIGDEAKAHRAADAAPAVSSLDAGDGVSDAAGVGGAGNVVQKVAVVDLAAAA